MHMCNRLLYIIYVHFKGKKLIQTIQSNITYTSKNFNQEVFDVIQNWDLSDVARFTSKKYPEIDINLAISEYCHWIYLLACVTDRLFAPNPDMDQIWHSHILHTRDYIRFCNIIKGEYIHHQHVEVDCVAKRKEQLVNTAKTVFDTVPFRCDVTACSDHYCFEMTFE